MKLLLAVLLSALGLAWGWDVYNAAPTDAHPWWVARQALLYLSGVRAIGLMSLATYLASRPAWLETPLGGMDRVYRTHKWAGILGGSFAVLHWLVEMSDDILKSSIGRSGRVPKEQFGNVLDRLRDLAEDLGFLMTEEREEPRRLSKAALETLAIIAYHQPVTRAEIESVRGVSISKGTLDLLLEMGFVRLRGRRRTQIGRAHV